MNSSPIGGESDRTRVRREPHKARYERDDVYAIVDATWLCSIGVIVDGSPLVLPSIYVRDGDSLLLHGSISALLLRAMEAGERVCVNVTLTDGLIVARSAFNSSVAYRSAVLFGSATRVEEPGEVERALDLLTDAVLPGRTEEVRRPTPSELRRTGVVRFTIEEASAKVSEGPPNDEVEDLEGPTWAGTVPIERSYGSPVLAPDLNDSVSPELPASVSKLLDRNA